MKKAVLVLVLAGLAATLGSSLTRAAGLSVAPGSMRRVATVDARYQSYNASMVEVTGGNFWKPYDAAALRAPKLSAPPGTIPRQVGQDPTLFQARPPISLANARLRRLAKALGPAYMRTSGSWANQSYFHDSDDPAPASPPAGFQGTLTRPQWRGVVEFAHAVDAKLTTSFAVGAGVRDANRRVDS